MRPFVLAVPCAAFEVAREAASLYSGNALNLHVLDIVLVSKANYAENLIEGAWRGVLVGKESVSISMDEARREATQTAYVL